jgi:hypothetical protein
MNAKQIGIGAALAGFVAVNVFGFVQGGWEGFLELFTRASPWTVVLLTDLTIALTLTAIWLWRDARQRGIFPLPYVVLMVATGSIGTLLYLLRREMIEHKERAAA